MFVLPSAITVADHGLYLFRCPVLNCSHLVWGQSLELVVRVKQHHLRIIHGEVPACQYGNEKDCARMTVP